MRKKGKILKVRIGHEANCSSGMISMFIVIYSSVGYLALALLASVLGAIVRGIGLVTGRQKNWVYALSWILPQVLGLGLTALLTYVTFMDNAPILSVGALVMSGLVALFTGIGHILMRRIRHPVFLFAAVLLAPLLFVICFSILAQMYLEMPVWEFFAPFFDFLPVSL